MTCPVCHHSRCRHTAKSVRGDVRRRSECMLCRHVWFNWVSGAHESVNCGQCLHWNPGGCGLGMPDHEIEGMRFARDCAAFAEAAA